MPFYEANVVQACTSSKDVTVDSYWRLTNQLNRFEFNVPIFEQYDSGHTFFGLFELRDLVTVRANCHRMLHNMQGEKRDISRLKAIVRRRRDSTGF